jgi:hypothetical protein
MATATVVIAVLTLLAAVAGIFVTLWVTRRTVRVDVRLFPPRLTHPTNTLMWKATNGRRQTLLYGFGLIAQGGKAVEVRQDPMSSDDRQIGPRSRPLGDGEVGHYGNHVRAVCEKLREAGFTREVLVWPYVMDSSGRTYKGRKSFTVNVDEEAVDLPVQRGVPQGW